MPSRVVRASAGSPSSSGDAALCNVMGPMVIAVAASLT
jgi:hypothetical protein